MFKNILNSIMSDLRRIEHLDKNALFEKRVQDTINTSYESYCKDLKINYDYLLFRDTLKVLKTIKHENMKREKKHEV